MVYVLETLLEYVAIPVKCRYLDIQNVLSGSVQLYVGFFFFFSGI